MNSTPNSSTLAAVIRRFPLLGRPRPACPSLPERVQEIADIAHAAGQDGADRLAEGTHALNKAALIASDCGLPDLARDLCWQHIDLYRAADRPLAVLHTRHMLEPVGEDHPCHEQGFAALDPNGTAAGPVRSGRLPAS